MKLHRFNFVSQIILSVSAFAWGVAGVISTWTMYFGAGGKEWFSPDNFFNQMGYWLVWFLVMALYGIAVMITSSLEKKQNKMDKVDNLYHQYRLFRTNASKLTGENAIALKKNKRRAIIVFSVCAAVLVLCMAMCIAFAFNYPLSGEGGAIQKTVGILAHISPWIAVAIVDLILFKIFFDKFGGAYVSLLRGAGKPEKSRPVLSKKSIWIIRGLVATCAVAFIVVGVINKGYADIYAKATKICLECIGIG